MTNQEAMQECLKIQAFAISEKQVEAMQTAIKALEQEPFMNKPCVAHQICREDKNKVLDKIKDEIEQDAFNDVNGSKFISVNRVNQIIDKYKAESEE